MTAPSAAPDAPPRPSRPPRRRPRAGLVGPLFRWELVRLARRGQDARARFILAASLLFVLTVFTVAWFPRAGPSELFFGTSQLLSLEQSAKFGEQFALAFVLAQLAVLVLLTPAYAAGGIAEEKEKKTFVFLLVSDLTSREILFGKFLGRLAFLLGVMLAGLPVLAITQVYGGVSLKFLLMSYLITATTVTMLAAVSAAAAAAADSFRGALFRAYGLTALNVLVGCGLHPVLSPFGIVAVLFGVEAEAPEFFLFVGLGYAGAQIVIAAVSVWLGVRWVRHMRAKIGVPPRKPRYHPDGTPVYRPKKRAGNPPGVNGQAAGRAEPVVANGDAEVLLGAEDEAAADGEPARAAVPLPTARAVKVAPVAPAPPPRPKRRRRPPPPPDPVTERPRVDGRDPFLWKERYTTGTKRTADDDSIRGVVIAVGVGVGVTVAFFVLISVMAILVSGFSRGGLEAAERLLMTGGAGGLFTYLLVVGSAAAGSVARERQRQTLESLLTIPVDRRAILRPKWLVSASRGWWWGAPAALALPLGFLVSGAPEAAVPAAGLAAASVPFVVGLGLWLSVRCRTVTRAVLWLLPAVGGLTLLPVAVWLAFDPRQADEAVAMTAALAAAAALVGGAAWAAWRLAVAAFEREGRG